MLNVWAAGTRMALAQRKAPIRNEVAGALEVLALLDFEGTIVSVDALLCPPVTAHSIRRRKGHYVLAIKRNRGQLFRDVNTLLVTVRRGTRGRLCGQPRRTAASRDGRLDSRVPDDKVSAFREFGEDEMDVRMDGRVAVITGASTGLGLAMAKEFAASGGSVALLARKADVLAAAKAEVAKAAGKTNGKFEAYSCDVAKAQPIADTFKKVVADFGKVDIVVNNAGISHAKPFDTVTDEDWQGDLDLKLFAAIRLCRAALPGMRERKWGRIVNVLNIGAKAPNANSTPTSVSRAAGLALTKALSQENAQHGVLVNAMLVGLIESDQWQRRHKARPTTARATRSSLAAMAKGRIPLGRMGKAEEFARMACFLCSDAGSFITGVAINVDGGASPVV